MTKFVWLLEILRYTDLAEMNVHLFVFPLIFPGYGYPCSRMGMGEAIGERWVMPNAGSISSLTKEQFSVSDLQVRGGPQCRGSSCFSPSLLVRQHRHRL